MFGAACSFIHPSRGLALAAMETLPAAPSRLARREAEIEREVRHTEARTRLKAVRPFQLPVAEALLSVLLIGSDELAGGLAAFCRVTRPERPEALDTLEGEKRFDLVLVELGFDLGDQQAWRSLMGAASDQPQHARWSRLKALGSVTLLWLTEPLSARAAFAEPLRALGPLFVADEAAALDPDVRYLPPAFDPHRFNPLKPTRAGRLAGDAPIVAIDQSRGLMYGDRRDALAADIERLSGFGISLGESRWKLRPDADHLPLVLLDRHLGRIEPDEHQALLALARFAAMPGRSGGIVAARQRLQALGSATLPIIVGEAGEVPPFCLGIEQAADQILPRYAGLFWRLERQAHQGYRDAHLRHGYRDRLREALAALDEEAAAGLAARLLPEVERRTVDLIVPTLRPWQLPFVYAMFMAQTHGPKRLVLMIHGEPFDLPVHFPAIAADDRVRWRFVPRDYGIGTLLNMAIEESEADYWAKIDDDDFYGPDYIRDYVILGGYADFAIAGKFNLFTYDEADDAVFNRKDVDGTFSRKETLAGGSFFCRRKAGLLPFDERVCGYADMDFLWRNEEAGRAIVASDRYNFCQIRRRDRASHTWKIRSEDIVGRERVANGRRFAAVCA